MSQITALADDLWNAFMLIREMHDVELYPEDMKIVEDTIHFRYGDDWFKIEQTH